MANNFELGEPDKMNADENKAIITSGTQMPDLMARTFGPRQPITTDIGAGVGPRQPAAPTPAPKPSTPAPQKGK